MNLNLDLNNFESPEAEGSRYVLTSPRSLEACARMRVRPVQLLPKPLEEFIEENPKKPLPLLQVFCDNHELKRTELLQKCRELRQTIIMEDKIESRKEPTRSRTLPRKNYSKPKEKMSISKSVGDKISHDENNNSEAIYEIIPSISENSPRNPKKTFKQSTPPRKFGHNLTPGPATFTKSKSKSEANLDEPYMISTPVIPAKFASNRSLDKSERMNESGGTLTRKSLAERNYHNRNRSRSLDFFKRKPRKSSNIELASSLKYANSHMMSGYSTPQQQKDQKIVEVLKEKRKQQEIDAKRIGEKQREWVDEKRMEEKKKQQDSLARERNLHQAQLEWEKRMKEKEDKRVREIRRNEQEKQMILNETEKQIERKKKEQERIQRTLFDERRKSELLRKQQQKAAKQTAEHEIEAFQEATEREIDSKLDKAQKNKLEAELKEISKLQYLNKSQREKFLKFEREIKKKQIEAEGKKKIQIHEKMEKADILRVKKITEREQTLKQQAKEEEERIQRAKDKQEESIRKNEEYLQTVAEQKKELLKRANTAQMQNVLTKSKRAQQLREISQDEQKKRLKEIEEEEKKYMTETKEILEAKDYRSKMHQHLKETAIRLSRANARAAEAARSEVKQNDDTFLEGHKHAVLLSSMGRGPRTGLVNASTVKFG